MKVTEMLDTCPEIVKRHVAYKKVKTGEIILEQGYEVTNIYMIINGSAKAYYTSQAGKNYLQDLIYEDNVIGELEIFGTKQSICNVEAVEEMYLAVLSGEMYKKWMLMDPEFAFFVNKSICDKLYNKIKKANDDVLYPLQYRLINLLIGMSDRKNTLKFKISKSTVAEELATSVRSVNRLFQDLKEKSLLDFDKSLVTIHNLENLENEKLKYT